MADHLRTQIRDAFVTALTGLSTTGNRVEVGRATPIAADAQPTLLVDVGGEAIVNSSVLARASRIQERTLEVVVRAAVKTAAGTYLDDLDQIAKEVEIALAGAQTLGGLCKSIQPRDFDEPEIDGTGNKTVAVMAMHFDVLYFAALNAPDTPR